MKKILLIVFLILLGLAFSCNSKKHTDKVSLNGIIEDSYTVGGLHYVEISFQTSSVGGVDVEDTGERKSIHFQVPARTNDIGGEVLLMRYKPRPRIQLPPSNELQLKSTNN